MKTLKDFIIEQIENMDSSELIMLNNTYCQECNYDTGEVYANDESFFETYFEDKPMEAVRAVHYGDYDYAHDYVKFNGYGNLESIRYFDSNDLVDNIEVIAEYAMENQREFDMLDFDFEEETDELN